MKPPHLFIDPQTSSLCAVHALNNSVQASLDLPAFTANMLHEGARIAARVLGDSEAQHHDVVSGDFSIEAVCQAVRLSNHYSCAELEVNTSGESMATLEAAFAPVDGSHRVLGILMHVGRHYVAIVRDALSTPTGAVLLDSLHPGIIEIWTAEHFRAAAVASRRTNVHGVEREVPAFKLLQVIEGKRADMDTRARAFAGAGGCFDLDHTRGYWFLDTWVPLHQQTGLKRAMPPDGFQSRTERENPRFLRV